MYYNGQVLLSNGRFVRAHLADGACASSGECLCGFCKGEGQCEFGTCRNPTKETADKLCASCAASEWRSALYGLSTPN